jgi:peptidoglycan/xylan/chitin deacetylase (PgdA/CDA1 family)
MFTRTDLDALLASGHELACHTYHHTSCFSVNTDQFVEDCAANKREVARLLGDYELRNMSFPNGHATLGAKRRLHASYDTCRSIAWGVNMDRMDLSYLRANPIYSRYGTESVRELVAEAVERKGWLVLYTHDIGPNPSLYGCTQEDFAEVLSSVKESGAEVVTIRDAVSRFTRV